MKTSMRLNVWIALSAFLLIAVAIGVAGFTLDAVGKIKEANRQLEQESKFELSSGMATYHAVQIQQFLTDASLTREQDSLKDAHENLEGFLTDITTLIELHPEFKDRLSQIRALGEKLSVVGLEMTKEYWDHGQAAGDAIMKRPKTGLDATSDEIGKLLTEFGKDAHEAKDKADGRLNQVIAVLQFQSLIVSGVLILLTVLVFGILYARLRPLQNINAELKLNLNELREASKSMRGTAVNISQANSDQASATQQTSTSLEQIRSTVDRTAESSKSLQDGAIESHRSIEVGKDKLQLVQTSLQDIDSESQNLVAQIESGNQNILQIVKIISEIESKTKVINDIVFQTKLLSFNASVEAARAGENGKGFAVVAEEVGNLAEMSGQAAKEISQMLEDSIVKVRSIVRSNADSVSASISITREKIATSVDTAKLCGEAFDEFVSQVDDVKTVSDELTRAIGGQVSGLEEIGKALEALVAATNSNVTASETAEQNSHLLENSVVQLGHAIQDVSGIIFGKLNDETSSHEMTDEVSEETSTRRAA